MKHIYIPLIAVGLVILGFVLYALTHQQPIRLGQLGEDYPQAVFLSSAGAATTNYTVAQVSAFRYYTIALNVATGSQVIKCRGSISDAKPNFGAVVSLTNSYDFLDLKDVNDFDVASSTITVSTSTVSRLYEVQAKNLKWLTCGITTYYNGTTTIRGFFTADK